MQFTFKCDSISLDFVGTLTSRREDYASDMLVAPEDAARWFAEAGIVDDELAFSADDLARAIELREAVWAVVASHLDGTAFPKKALKTVNAVAAGPDPVPRLAADGRHVTATPDQAMSAVARDVIDILTGPSAGVIKECSRDGCNQVYIDRSRGSRREWCSMELCGSRVKSRDYRARKAAAV